MNSNDAAQHQERPGNVRVSLRRGTFHLDQRYGEIGISAVAAAVRYQNLFKNPAYAPVPMRPADWLLDLAA